MLEGPPEVPAALLDELEEAFPPSTPPLAGVEQPSHCSGCRGLTAGLLGRQWREVESRDIDATVDANAMLTAEAFVYYVPAYVRRAAQQFFEPGLGVTMVVDFIVHSLADPELPSDPWWNERAVRFTLAQHRAIASFLSWVAAVIGDDEDEARLAGYARDALERFWAKSPAGPG